MEIALDSYGGLGLSANQLGINKRVCLIRVREHDYFLVNPVITEKSQEGFIFFEGCLSIPKTMEIPLRTIRSTKIKVQTDNLGELEFEVNPDGDKEQVSDETLLTVVVQHEIDHLEIGPMYAKKEEYWLNVTNGKYKRADKPEFDNLDVRFPGTYIKVTGDNVVERYLDDDLEETLVVDDEFNQGSFLLASMIPTTYERVSTMGTATLWKMLMLAWSYKFKLAIPKKQDKTDFVGGLSRLLKVGYSRNVLKLD